MFWYWSVTLILAMLVGGWVAFAGLGTLPLWWTMFIGPTLACACALLIIEGRPWWACIPLGVTMWLPLLLLFPFSGLVICLAWFIWAWHRGVFRDAHPHPHH